MTCKQVTQSDARVIAHRAEGRWKEAWTLVADAIIATHTGDRHVALRNRLKPGAYLAQLGDMTVADAATAHLEDVQSRQVLGLWDGIATLLHDVEEDAKTSMFGLSLLGLDFTDGRERQLHKHFVSVLQAYLDRQRTLELFGALKEENQTHIENEISSKLLPTVGGRSATRRISAPSRRPMRYASGIGRST
jgi:hypothetical protein